MPEISVVMPNFNRSAYISTAIESVLSQTKSDIELIVVDDASTDDSVGMVEGISRKDPRVRLISQRTHEGVSKCRNLGIRSSNADTIAFIDSDDVYAPHALELMLDAILASSTPTVVYSDCWYLDEGGGRLPPPTQRVCTKSGKIFVAFLFDGFAAEANLMLPKRMFERVGYFDESISWGEDTDLIFRLSLEFPFKYIDEQLYGYRFHPGNTWYGMSPRQKLAIKTPMIEKYFKANIRLFDQESRRIARWRLIDMYLGARESKRAITTSLSDIGLFARFLRMRARMLRGRYLTARHPHPESQPFDV